MTVSQHITLWIIKMLYVAQTKCLFTPSSLIPHYLILSEDTKHLWKRAETSIPCKCNFMNGFIVFCFIEVKSICAVKSTHSSCNIFPHHHVQVTAAHPEQRVFLQPQWEQWWQQRQQQWEQRGLQRRHPGPGAAHLPTAGQAALHPAAPPPGLARPQAAAGPVLPAPPVRTGRREGRLFSASSDVAVIYNHSLWSL